MATGWGHASVRVARPPEVSLGDFLGEMREWLDHHRVTTVDFRSAPAERRGEFEIRFNSLADARLFGQRFAPTSGTVIVLDHLSGLRSGPNIGPEVGTLSALQGSPSTSGDRFMDEPAPQAA
jgi:hypothetical protein